MRKQIIFEFDRFRFCHNRAVGQVLVKAQKASNINTEGLKLHTAGDTRRHKTRKQPLRTLRYKKVYKNVVKCIITLTKKLRIVHTRWMVGC